MTHLTMALALDDELEALLQDMRSAQGRVQKKGEGEPDKKRKGPAGGDIKIGIANKSKLNLQGAG